jgi:hypothetical protein
MTQRIVKIHIPKGTPYLGMLKGEVTKISTQAIVSGFEYKGTREFFVEKSEVPKVKKLFGDRFVMIGAGPSREKVKVCVVLQDFVYWGSPGSGWKYLNPSHVTIEY